MLMNDRLYKIFLVDDDIKTLMLIKSYLEKKITQFPIDISIFAYGENCLDRMGECPDIVVLDYFLDGIREDAQDGLQILKQIKTISPDTDVIFMSGQSNVETAIETLRWGAYDYIAKNERALQRLEILVNKAILEQKRLEAETF